MADSTNRQQAIEAAKERARQRIQNARQDEESSRVSDVLATEGTATPIELTANEQMAADQRLTESGRLPAAGSELQQPDLGQGSGTPNDTGGPSPARALAEGNDLLSGRFQQPSGYSPETQAALDVFEQVVTGNAGSPATPVSQSDDSWRPGMSGGRQGIQSGQPGGGFAQETGGREGAGYGMNEVFTEQAMRAAANGDEAALDRLAKQVREHYGLPEPGASGATESDKGAANADGAGVGYSGAAGFDEGEGVRSNVGDDWAKEYPTLAKIASIFTGETSVSGATTKGWALQQAVDEIDANAQGSTEQPVDSEELTAKQRAELAEWFEQSTGIDPATGGRAGANSGDGRTDPADYATPETGAAPVNARDRLRGGDDPLAPGTTNGEVSADDFDVVHSQDDVINYGDQGGGANTGGTPYTDMPDTNREDGPISVNVPGAGGTSTSDDPFTPYSAARSRISESSLQAAETRFATAGDTATQEQKAETGSYTTQRVGDDSDAETRKVDLGESSLESRGSSSDSESRQLSEGQQEFATEFTTETEGRSAVERPDQDAGAPEIRGATTPSAVPGTDGTELIHERPSSFAPTEDALTRDSSQASATLDVFNTFRDGARPTLEGRTGDIARPGMTGTETPSGDSSANIMDGAGRTPGMNTFFTEKAMEYAAQGDDEALDRLTRQVHEYYGGEQPPSTIVVTGDQIPDSHANAPQYDLVSGNPALGNAVYTDASGELFASVPAGSVVRATTLAEGETRAAAQFFTGAAGEEVKTGVAPKEPGPDGEGGNVEQEIVFTEYLRGATRYDGGYRGGGGVDPGRHDSGEGDADVVDTSNPLKADTAGAAEESAVGDVSRGDLDFTEQQDDVIYAESTPAVGPTLDVPVDVGPEPHLALDPFADSDAAGERADRESASSLSRLAESENEPVGRDYADDDDLFD